MAITISDTFTFNHSSYYYWFEGPDGSASGANYVAYKWKAGATYWCFSKNAVYGKKFYSLKLSITADAYEISDSKTIKLKIGCAKLKSTSDPNENLFSSESSFNKKTEAKTLPHSDSVVFDITEVVQYAADNYTEPWGLYIYAIKEANGTGSSNKVTIADPTISTLILNGTIKYYNNNTWNNCFINYYNGTKWVQVQPYYYNGSKWILTGV
jgi:hypothetical protein